MDDEPPQGVQFLLLICIANVAEETEHTAKLTNNYPPPKKLGIEHRSADVRAASLRSATCVQRELFAVAARFLLFIFVVFHFPF